MSTSRDVVTMLRRHYLPEGRPAGGIFAPEIESPCGKRRADLIWMPTTIAGGRGLVGHEVKVSRADVATELADPTKADPWGKFCDRWWLVVSDPALVDGLTIPEAWGIMAPPSGRRTRSMTILRPAPKLNPIDRAAGVERLASWMLYRHSEAESEMRRDLQWKDQKIRDLEAQIRQLRDGAIAHVSPHAARVGQIIERVRREGSDEGIWGSVTDDQIVRAVLDMEHVRHFVNDAKRELDNLVEKLKDPLRYAAEHLGKIGTEIVSAGTESAA